MIAEKFKHFVVVDGEAPLISLLSVEVPCIKGLLVMSTHCQNCTALFAFIALMARPCPASVYVYATPNAIVDSELLLPVLLVRQKRNLNKSVEMSNQLRRENAQTTSTTVLL